VLKPGKSIDGFITDLIGEFYAYYQWFYNIPSAIFVRNVSIDFLINAYHRLHDLDIDIAVKKLVLYDEYCMFSQSR